jgi:hypothetical protein
MWTYFCNGITRQLKGKYVEIEIASRSLGVQRAARWVPLVGFAYDRKRDTLEIAIEGLDHLVMRPRELYAEFGPRGLESIGILDSDAAWQIVWLRDPLMLPPPTETPQ